MVIKNENYQRSIFLTSGNEVVSTLYDWDNSFFEFLNLKTANKNLSEENTTLKNQVLNLKNELAVLHPIRRDSIDFRIPPEMQYRFISAKVINCSTNKLQNYITIDRGSKDGIKPDMGVVNNDGVVGIVKNVSDNFAVVIPILNPKLEISCRLKRNNYIGALMWNGEDTRFANLTDIARHVELSLGDTLITSGLTPSFPEGIPVGRVEDFKLNQSDAYYSIKVELAVDFKTISYVKIINYLNFKEQRDLEKVSEEPN